MRPHKKDIANVAQPNKWLEILGRKKYIFIYIFKAKILPLCGILGYKPTTSAVTKKER